VRAKDRHDLIFDGIDLRFQRFIGDAAGVTTAAFDEGQAFVERLGHVAPKDIIQPVEGASRRSNDAVGDIFGFRVSCVLIAVGEHIPKHRHGQGQAVRRIHAW